MIKLPAESESLDALLGVEALGQDLRVQTCSHTDVFGWGFPVLDDDDDEEQDDGVDALDLLEEPPGEPTSICKAAHDLEEYWFFGFDNDMDNVRSNLRKNNYELQSMDGEELEGIPVGDEAVENEECTINLDNFCRENLEKICSTENVNRILTETVRSSTPTDNLEVFCPENLNAICGPSPIRNSEDSAQVRTKNLDKACSKVASEGCTEDFNKSKSPDREVCTTVLNKERTDISEKGCVVVSVKDRTDSLNCSDQFSEGDTSCAQSFREFSADTSSGRSQMWSFTSESESFMEYDVADSECGSDGSSGFPSLGFRDSGHGSDEDLRILHCRSSTPSKLSFVDLPEDDIKTGTYQTTREDSIAETDGSQESEDEQGERDICKQRKSRVKRKPSLKLSLWQTGPDTGQEPFSFVLESLRIHFSDDESLANTPTSECEFFNVAQVLKTFSYSSKEREERSRRRLRTAWRACARLEAAALRCGRGTSKDLSEICRLVDDVGYLDERLTHLHQDLRSLVTEVQEQRRGLIDIDERLSHLSTSSSAMTSNFRRAWCLERLLTQLESRLQDHWWDSHNPDNPDKPCYIV
ncbi:uncharacterized protein LOC143036456 isoform X2 [Oratosquilla oratoria]|uniref:uncharacterized protein LOC143036456 isoform X2 n=1 Tax=Oratosquilla oratoria TaxID=337810 RepID=UPI003F7762F5